MKPILVNNQQEWERLAPVLEKQGYNWHHPLFQLPQPSFGMRQCFNESTRVVIYLNECLQWSPLPLHDSRPTQSVDEYLLNTALLEMGKVALKAAGAPEDTPIFATTDYNHKQNPYEPQKLKRNSKKLGQIVDPFDLSKGRKQNSKSLEIGGIIKTEDWEAKYKALEQGVRDAINEIESAIERLANEGSESVLEFGGDGEQQAYQTIGLHNAIEIIKAKITI